MLAVTFFFTGYALICVLFVSRVNQPKALFNRCERSPIHSVSFNQKLNSNKQQRILNLAAPVALVCLLQRHHLNLFSFFITLIEAKSSNEPLNRLDKQSVTQYTSAPIKRDQGKAKSPITLFLRKLYQNFIKNSVSS